jgi:TnpA family transposase
MTKLTLLSAKDKRRYDSPSVFNTDEQSIYFSITDDLLKIINKLYISTNKVGFLLQLGYFKATGKFYLTNQFRPKDIEFVIHNLGLNTDDINLMAYQGRTPIDHRVKILNHLNWHSLNKAQQVKLLDHINRYTQKQCAPKQIMLSVIDICWQDKIELPSYDWFLKAITQAYNHYEKELLQYLINKLTPEHIVILDQYIHSEKITPKKYSQRPLITKIKHIEQSERTSNIQDNVEAFSVFKKYFDKLETIIEGLALTDQATVYFATWVQKAKVFQLSQFPNKYKAYLYLLAYIKHQFYLRHDSCVDILIKSTQAAINAANSQLNQLEKQTRSSRNKAIKKLSKSNKNSRELIEDITKIVKSLTLSEVDKLAQITALVDEFHAQHDIEETLTMIQLEQSLDEMTKNKTYFDALESVSLKLQHKVSAIIKYLEFDVDNSDKSLLKAISHFKVTEGHVGHEPPLCFLYLDEKEVLQASPKFQISLYKALLFIHIADAIKSGRLNLRHSYRYKAIQDYLINKNTWEKQKKELIQAAALEKFINYPTVISDLKQQTNKLYQQVNEHVLQEENPHLAFNEQGKIKIATPKIESHEMEYISKLLTQNGYIPISQALADINRIIQFTTCFKYFSNKYKKMKPRPEIIFAGLMGKGCNIGIHRLANISVGISAEELKNTVNWCFSLANIQAANQKILSLINKLILANAFCHEPGRLHTSSDGQKMNVAVDSLHANYSYKYFGRGKGVTMYTFIDERQMLFHSTVLSSSEREAAYVIDGLLQNEVIKSDIHSTDSHGYTETVFAATHFLDIAFAPRIKNMSDKYLYSFVTQKTYAKKGYKILPSRTINLKLIELHWDDILRFMVTIKLKETTASQLFKRLSSYAKDHPLYKALKEFGRIIKSQFLLAYFDDVNLRQRIEKQLNRIELSNRFSKAVFFANNQEFKQGTKEEQEVSTACKVFIQNAIVLWNYLYLSQLVANAVNRHERRHIAELITKGSVITWRHINMQGEYDFTKRAANSKYFDIEKILALKLAV